MIYRDQPAHWPGQRGAALTVLSANLHHDWPRHRQIQQRLEALSQLIEKEGVDLALLQEVSRTQTFHADRWLSDRLGMAYVYTRANGHEGGIGFEEGLAIYSRYPLKSPTLTELTPVMPFTRRIGLGAQMETARGSLPVFSVHLGVVPGQNSNQLKQLRQWIGSQTGDKAALIGGLGFRGSG
jgi:endonuclease/exonuclease/phosphatase family metal-dependent hydrolase